MKPFTLDQPASRIIFATGSVSRLREELERLTVTRPLFISTPGRRSSVEQSAQGLTGMAVAIHAESLPVLIKNPGDLEARSEALYGGWLAGVVLGSVGMALHHNISHVLGGSFNLPHANVHTIVLPHAIAFNREAVPEAMRAVADALGATDAAQGIYDLILRIEAPVALKDIGMPENQLERAARIVMDHAYYNPRPLDWAGVRGVLEAAYQGARPSTSN